MMKWIIYYLTIITVMFPDFAFAQTSDVESLVSDIQKTRQQAEQRAQDAIAGAQRPDDEFITEFAGEFTEEKGPALYIFVSFSMPDNLLSQYVEQAEIYGGSLVLNGLVNGSFPETIARAERIIGQSGELGGFVIDPSAFESFGIKTVPAIVLSESELGPCLSKECDRATPKHDVIYGAVTLPYALEQFISSGETKTTALEIWRAGQ